MTASPVVTSVSQATRPLGSLARIASSTPSEIWSAILSGWPSVTDSEVKSAWLDTAGAGVAGCEGGPAGVVAGSGGGDRPGTGKALEVDVLTQRAGEDRHHLV